MDTSRMKNQLEYVRDEAWGAVAQVGVAIALRGGREQAPVHLVERQDRYRHVACAATRLLDGSMVNALSMLNGQPCNTASVRKLCEQFPMHEGAEA